MHFPIAYPAIAILALLPTVASIPGGSVPSIPVVSVPSLLRAVGMRTAQQNRATTWDCLIHLQAYMRMEPDEAFEIEFRPLESDTEWTAPRNPAATEAAREFVESQLKEQLHGVVPRLEFKEENAYKLATLLNTLYFTLRSTRFWQMSYYVAVSTELVNGRLVMIMWKKPERVFDHPEFRSQEGRDGYPFHVEVQEMRQLLIQESGNGLHASPSGHSGTQAAG
ncbi:hypothetical protein C8R42DRAFT_715076 [Lentinula raphanica]|nr:hypothetical protein C8R42DRAFT_715076 [Lentinula raphanica]